MNDTPQHTAASASRQDPAEQQQQQQQQQPSDERSEAQAAEAPSTQKPAVEESPEVASPSAVAPSAQTDKEQHEESRDLATQLQEQATITPHPSQKTDEQLDPVEPPSESVESQPKPVESPSESVQAQPEPAQSPPEPAQEQQEMKEDQPESAQDQQETTQNQQENTRELSEKTDRDRASSEQPALPPRPRTSTQGYRLKDVEWRDTETGRVRDVKIVTQNENGPCPLIALANVLTLSGKLQLGPASRRTVTEAELTSMLADRLLSQDVGTPGASETDVSMILSLLPTMNTGLDVDLQFSHIYDFADTPPAQLFRVFGADLVHGWVVDMDQEADIAETLRSDCRSNYEGAVEFIFAADELSHGQVVGDGTPAAKIDEPAPSLSDKQQRNVHAAVALNRWLAANATQLTPAGLRFLGTQLPENHLCVLFRNNHFSTLYKRGVGELFILCTDDVVAGDTRIVWESLRDVHQATSQFLDSSFQPLGAATGQGGGSRENPDYAHQSREGRGPQGESAAQIDSDYAMALRLHEQEQERENQQRQQQQSGNSAGQLQVRQQDRLPPGMTQRGSLYGVPEVTPGGESRLARAMHRTRSDENFEQRMQNTWLPNEPKSPRTKKAQQDKCTIC